MTRALFITTAWLLTVLCASAAEPFDLSAFKDRLNAALNKRDYKAAEQHIQAALASAGAQRPVVIASALYFYVFFQPDYGRVQAAVAELDNFVAARGTVDDVKLVRELLKDIKAIPKHEYTAPTPEQRDMLHKEFQNSYIHPLLVPLLQRLSQKA